MRGGVAERLAQEALAGAGLSAHLVPAHGMRRALERRMKALGFAEVREYEALYAADASEREAYLEGLLIGETSFFRDGAVFAEMLRWCVRWFAENAGTMKILCAPCSTGEEPYSIAAMLLDAGVAAQRFAVEGLDLSATAIAQARTAEYAGLALRNLADPGECWFLERGSNGWRVVEKVRRCVRFRQANLLEAHVLGDARYDLICCRNLMIYQTAAAREHVAGALAAALVPGGRVVLGSADWCRELTAHFALEIPMQSFALRLRERLAAVAEETVMAPAALEPKVAEVVVEQRATELSELYRAALEAYGGGEERRAESLCRQALYVDAEHVASLELLSRLARPHVPQRHRLALQARLERLGRTGDVA